MVEISIVIAKQKILLNDKVFFLQDYVHKKCIQQSPMIQSSGEDKKRKKY